MQLRHRRRSLSLRLRSRWTAAVNRLAPAALASERIEEWTVLTPITKLFGLRIVVSGKEGRCTQGPPAKPTTRVLARGLRSAPQGRSTLSEGLYGKRLPVVPPDRRTSARCEGYARRSGRVRVDAVHAQTAGVRPLPHLTALRADSVWSSGCRWEPDQRSGGAVSWPRSGARPSGRRQGLGHAERGRLRAHMSLGSSPSDDRIRAQLVSRVWKAGACDYRAGCPAAPTLRSGVREPARLTNS
mgnify:CR=1 FL=1